MHDLHKDAFLEGRFRVMIEVQKTDEGYHAEWTGPRGQKIEADNSSQSQAHRDVENKLREGVLNGTVTLGT